MIGVYGVIWLLLVLYGSSMEAGYLLAIWQLHPIDSHFIYPHEQEYNHAQARQASGTKQKTFTHTVGVYSLAPACCLSRVRLACEAVPVREYVSSFHLKLLHSASAAALTSSFPRVVCISRGRVCSKHSSRLFKDLIRLFVAFHGIENSLMSLSAYMKLLYNRLIRPLVLSFN